MTAAAVKMASRERSKRPAGTAELTAGELEIKGWVGDWVGGCGTGAEKGRRGDGRWD